MTGTCKPQILCIQLYISSNMELQVAFRVDSGWSGSHQGTDQPPDLLSFTRLASAGTFRLVSGNVASDRCRCRIHGQQGLRQLVAAALWGFPPHFPAENLGPLQHTFCQRREDLTCSAMATVTGSSPPTPLPSQHPQPQTLLLASGTSCWPPHT